MWKRLRNYLDLKLYYSVKWWGRWDFILTIMSPIINWLCREIHLKETEGKKKSTNINLRLYWDHFSCNIIRHTVIYVACRSGPTSGLGREFDVLDSSYRRSDPRRAEQDPRRQERRAGQSSGGLCMQTWWSLSSGACCTALHCCCLKSRRLITSVLETRSSYLRKATHKPEIMADHRSGPWIQQVCVSEASFWNTVTLFWKTLMLMFSSSDGRSNFYFSKK